MDEFFCKTRLFWAISRILFSLASAFDVYSKFKNLNLSNGESIINLIILGYAVCLFIIAVNEIREKETNTSFLRIIGSLTLLIAVAVVGLTIGHLKDGFGLLLVLFFSWMVILGLKDILGNHFYIE